MTEQRNRFHVPEEVVETKMREMVDCFGTREVLGALIRNCEERCFWETADKLGKVYGWLARQSK